MSGDDARPPLWVGHVVLESNRLSESAAFMRSIGMRPIFEGPAVAIFELRGGTHLIITPKEEITAGDLPFDLMVEDIRGTHARFTALGLAPTAIEALPGIDHERFFVVEPAGHRIAFYSNHVSGKPV